MFSFIDRLGPFAIACALLFAAVRIHRSTGRHQRMTKPVGLVVAFLAGASFLVTFVGSWMASIAGRGAGPFFVAALIVCAVIIVVDWGFDKKPDRPAFWAAFSLAAVMVFGAASIPQATGQVGNGVTKVTSEFQQATNNQPAPKKTGR